ncbi:MAG: class I SAM-dependent methyltransferase [Candidatus Paceibacterota bacterium]
MKKIEEVKNYWDARPCNIRHSQKSIGSREYFDEVEKRKYFVEPHIPKFAQFNKWKDKEVLELGCGIGTDSINFARLGARLTVVELSKESLDLAKKRFKVFGLEVKFYEGNIENLSSFLPQKKYDLIYSFGVIHHTPSPEKVFKEIKKYCKPETEIKIMLYSKWCWKVFWIIMGYGKGQFWKTKTLVPKYSEAQTGSPVTYIYSFNEIRHLMKDFKVVKISKDHIFPYIIKNYKKYQYKKVWYFRYLPHSIFHWLEKRLGWHTLIIAKLK